jgi:uncharacterized membrane protein YdbT with pleckstrin-like domain
MSSPQSAVPPASPAPASPAPDVPVWVGHPSHWHYFWYWFFGLLLIPVVIGIFLLAYVFIDRARNTYMITAHKIMIETGLIAKSSNEIRIRDIRSINLLKHGMVGFLNVGDLEFSSSASDKAEIVFHAIPKVTAVRDLVRGYQDKDN